MACAANIGSLALDIITSPYQYRWRGGSAWYPGVVESVSGNQVTIRYDDGTRETRPANQVRPYDWRVGTHVSCLWTDGNWYRATITAMDPGGLEIDVLYDDGDRQRTPRPDAAASIEDDDGPLGCAAAHWSMCVRPQMCSTLP